MNLLARLDLPVNHTKLIALLTLSLFRAGCHSFGAQSSSLEWEVPSMQLGGDHGLPSHPIAPSSKRNSDNHKLFFNPGRAASGGVEQGSGW